MLLLHNAAKVTNVHTGCARACSPDCLQDSCLYCVSLSLPLCLCVSARAHRDSGEQPEPSVRSEVSRGLSLWRSSEASLCHVWWRQVCHTALWTRLPGRVHLYARGGTRWFLTSLLLLFWGCSPGVEWKHSCRVFRSLSAYIFLLKLTISIDRDKALEEWDISMIKQDASMTTGTVRRHAACCSYHAQGFMFQFHQTSELITFSDLVRGGGHSVTQWIQSTECRRYSVLSGGWCTHTDRRQGSRTNSHLKGSVACDMTRRRQWNSWVILRQRWNTKSCNISRMCN